MTRGRKTAVGIGILAVLALHLANLPMSPVPEAWPFVRYGMFSGLRSKPEARGSWFVGVSIAGTEIDLNASRYWAPLDLVRLDRAARRAAADSGKARDLVRYLLHRYEERRVDGHHGGPPLSALRVEEITANWSNGITPEHVRVQHRVIAEGTP